MGLRTPHVPASATATPRFRTRYRRLAKTPDSLLAINGPALCSASRECLGASTLACSGTPGRAVALPRRKRSSSLPLQRAGRLCWPLPACAGLLGGEDGKEP